MVKEIQIKPRKREEWEMDDEKYFLIRTMDGKIEVAVMQVQDDHRNKKLTKDHKKITKYIGSDPTDIYYKIVKDKHISNQQHAAYLGMELEKAHIALKTGRHYVQDKELRF